MSQATLNKALHQERCATTNVKRLKSATTSAFRAATSFVVAVCTSEMGKKRGGGKNSGLGKTILKERSRKKTKGQSWVCILVFCNL